MTENKFGNNLKTLRKQKGLTQFDLSKLLDVSVMTIRRFEAGTRMPKLYMIQKIAETLNVNIGNLIGITDEDKERGYITAAATVKLSDEDNKLFGKYLSLNETGQQKVKDYVSDLCEIDKYCNNPQAFRNPDEE